MKLAVVTGATGCVGRNLVDELIKDQWKIIALHRNTSDITRLAGCDVSLLEVDLHNLESVREAIPENVDALFHVAGNTSHWRKEAAIQWKDNVLTTKNLVQVSLERKVKRFIFTSTGATLGYQGADERLTETIKNGYIRTKRLAEIEVYKGIDKGLDAVVLHPIIVIGAYDYNSYSQIFQGIKNRKFKAAFPGRIAFCHAKDVAYAHISAFEKGRTAENYVLGGSYTTWLDTFQRIALVVGVEPPEKVFSKAALSTVAYLMAIISFFTRKPPMPSPELVSLLRDAPDVNFQEKRKAKETLGYESQSLDKMIQDCYKWLEMEGRI